MSPDHPFFILLRSGLYETGCHLPPSVSTDEWFTWMKWAGDQAVLGLFYRGTEHLPLDYPLPEELSFSLLAAVDGIEKRNRHLQATLPEILDYFLHPGLHPRVMKGPEAARFYRYPLLRQSGDLDLFFSCDEFHAAIALADAGLERGGERPDRSRHYTLKGIELDIHDRYFDLHTDRKRLPSVPSPEATLLMLSAHILKHAMGPGIGLRQLCDMAMACEALEGSYAPSSLHRFARESGTWRWNRLLTAFLQQYLDPSKGEKCEKEHIRGLWFTL